MKTGIGYDVKAVEQTGALPPEVMEQSNSLLFGTFTRNQPCNTNCAQEWRQRGRSSVAGDKILERERAETLVWTQGEKNLILRLLF